MQTAISVQNLTKIYSSGEAAVLAIDGVNLNVNSGEVVLLMGPSGSGKTTLLSIMGCILRPTSGSVRICNREVTGLSEKELPKVRLDHIGFVFQAFNLFPTLTAGENVELALDLKGISSKESRRLATGLIEQVGLKDKYNVFPSNLSGGQKQRVAIARALAGNPDIILADEPTAALDSHSGLSVMKMLHNLAHKGGRAVVIVSHDNRTLEFADRIVNIEDGKILKEHIPSIARMRKGTLPKRTEIANTIVG
ncbi:MAG: ABC transporter ATP-binding protein [Candidatus Dadabacteria bacterium]|nr:ABC transporter ATP-binding protein [Candidatus Dadabacteria bacterium]